MDCTILLYHGIDAEAAPYVGRSDDELEWVVDATTFERHLAAIAELGLEVVTLDALLGTSAGPRRPGRPIVITFDDGHRTNYDNAWPLLRTYGFPAVFFVTSGWIGAPGYMRGEQLRELEAAGSLVGSHGVTHRFLSELDEAETERELRESRDAIRAACGVDVRHLAYPGGRFDARTEELARRAGYLTTCTSVRGWNDLGGSPFALRRQGISRFTTDEEFRAAVTHDRAFFAMRAVRRAAVGAARHLVGGKRYARWREAARSIVGK